VILTVDLGTTRTKAVLWGDHGPVGSGSSTLQTAHPVPGWAEQDASDWWPSVVDACAAARGAASLAAGGDGVEAVGFAAARQSVVPVAPNGAPIGPALVWSDRRGGGSVVGKAQWLRHHAPERMAAARWLLAPRDLVAWYLTGTVATDPTLASLPPECALGPPVLASTAVLGPLLPGPAAELGLPAAVPVVLGAGDRQCEVLGTCATAEQPMVSWGTTANVSFPLASPPSPVASAPSPVASPPSPTERPPLRLTRGALDGWLLEGGLAAAGSLLAWLGGLTGMAVDELAAAAASSPPGAGGVTCLPWLGGARAPWWRAGAGAGFLGLGPSHGPGDMARAAMEGVAFDLARCIEASRLVPSALALAGGAGLVPWADIVTGVTGVPGVVRASGDAASVGALAVATQALGRPIDVEAYNPVTAVITPPPAMVERYRELRAVSDAAVAAVLPLAPSAGPTDEGGG
jgi:xylulokinase